MLLSQFVFRLYKKFGIAAVAFSLLIAACSSSAPTGPDGESPADGATDSAVDVTNDYGGADAADVAPAADVADSSAGGGKDGLDALSEQQPERFPDADASEAGALDGASAEEVPATQRYFTFLPSNLAIEQLRLSDAATLGDALVDGDSCEWDRFEQKVDCINGSTISPVAGYKMLLVRLNDDPPLLVLVARSWTITARTTFALGSRTAVVALGNITVDGHIIVGFADTSESGVGSPGDFRVGAGGGAFCGHGGAGAYSSAGRAAPYGTPSLIPPHVGSSGGPVFGSGIGAGGGFVHLLAAQAIHIHGGASVWAGGQAGYGEGAGGSGGAILVESLMVDMAGILAANGAGGGSANNGLSTGKDGTTGSDRAAGATDMAGNKVAGQGGAGSFADGDDAMSISITAGGGGGVGRIRINTVNGQAGITGVISPAVDTGCATQGTVTPLP